MVEKLVVENKPDTIYKCGKCDYHFKYKTDAQKCEDTPVKKFRFEIGDKVGISKNFGMVVSRYIRSMADSDYYTGLKGDYEGGSYERPKEFGRSHQNRYGVYIKPETCIELLSSKPDDALRERLSNKFFGKIDEREDDLNKTGRYDSVIIEKLRKLNKEVFKSV